jgi:hypothetical protein
VEIFSSNDGSQVCVKSLWNSKGIKENGEEFSRTGRCTFILKADTDSKYKFLGIHNHYSLKPKATRDNF